MQHNNRYALLRHRGLLPAEDGVDSTYEKSIRRQPPPKLLVELDAAGYHLVARACQTGEYWHWVDPDGVRASYDCLTLPQALRVWEEVNRYPGATKHSEGSVLIASLNHTLAAGHRLAAQDSVPKHVTVPPDARVSPVEKDGRVAGVWVDAKVYVSLSS